MGAETSPAVLQVISHIAQRRSQHGAARDGERKFQQHELEQTRIESAAVKPAKGSVLDIPQGLPLGWFTLLFWRAPRA